jgi:hypothetical protein
VADESPIVRLLDAVTKLDVDAAAALLAPDVRLRAAHGRHAEGVDAVRELLGDFFGSLRSISYRITGQWHDGDVWIAEFEAEYEMRDWLQTGPLPRAVVLREAPDGVAEVRVYGANETDLADHPTGEEGSWMRERWIPPL